MKQNSRRQLSKTFIMMAGVMLVSVTGWSQSANSAAMPDAQIEANVLKALAGAGQLATENIITNTVYGTVTLSGTVKDESTRQLAETVASRARRCEKGSR